ncbi:DUF1636 domain-containing protein [Hansschlegelia plantiphila]|uniref:DUF1636 domain-containing protein n=1 Tax=Hansschlegelia plantiphila TaxID=374655 RepID=A0A9W6J0K8_9HYPH|nr:DUF1636 domain-containing protein [Hansschlegelia plantiphila]GLK67518.1 hypothetical protein GCM10008179_11560 [Hansschlegelia plantiphila]
MTAKTTLTVCSTCRPDGAADAEPRPGALLGQAVARALDGSDAGLRIEARAIACLSACSRACSASVAAPGKFAYVIGGLEPADAEALIAFATAHAESADGVPPWRARPEKIRKSTVSRTPPPGVAHPLVAEIAGEDALTPRR